MGERAMGGKIIPVTAACLAALLLVGCETVPPVDAPLQLSGARGANFDTDSAQCRAEAKRVGQGHVQTTAVVSGVGGALVGATESGDKALAGAVIAAATGAAVADAQVKQAQRQNLVDCMRRRGHPVVG